MTRVSSYLRDELFRVIMKDLPTRKFYVEIHDLVQKIAVEHMPAPVRAVYDDEKTRTFLAKGYFEVRKGNMHVALYGNGEQFDRVYGLQDSVGTTFRIRMDDMEHISRLKKDTLYADIVKALHDSKLVDEYFAQEELRSKVASRLKANLRASSTFKQLYTNLEPELHHYIPKNEVATLVPACVAPVVDDLRKLGAVLPEVPKVATAS